MGDLSRKLMERIETGHIHPAPRWQFVLGRAARWVAVGFVAFLCALALSVLVSVVADLDWSVYLEWPGVTRWTGVIASLPYVWMSAVAALVAFSWRGVRFTERGYRFSGVRLGIVLAFVLSVIGGILFASSVGRYADELARMNVPGYDRVVLTKEAQWSRPDEGLLAGTVEAVDGRGFSLEDFGGRSWEVSTNDATVIRPRVSIESGETVKIVGTRRGNDGFQAEEIRPWDGRRNLDGRHGPSTRPSRMNGARDGSLDEE